MADSRPSNCWYTMEKCTKVTPCIALIIILVLLLGTLSCDNDFNPQSIINNNCMMGLLMTDAALFVVAIATFIAHHCYFKKRKLQYQRHTQYQKMQPPSYYYGTNLSYV